MKRTTKHLILFGLFVFVAITCFYVGFQPQPTPTLTVTHHPDGSIKSVGSTSYQHKPGDGLQVSAAACEWQRHDEGPGTRNGERCISPDGRIVAGIWEDMRQSLYGDRPDGQWSAWLNGADAGKFVSGHAAKDALNVSLENVRSVLIAAPLPEKK